MKMGKSALVIATGLVLATGGFRTPANAAEAEKGEASRAVKPSNLIFLPEVEEMTGGGNIEIKFTAKAGKVQLWIDDEKIGEADSPAAFKWTLPSRKKSYKVEIRKGGKVLVGRYIPKKHPYFFFSDRKKSPLYRYRNEDPYKTWLSSNSPGDPMKAALHYVADPKPSYVDICKKALLEFKMPGDKYSHYCGLDMKYPIMYDIIAPALTKEERKQIEDRFMQAAQTMAQFLKKPVGCDVGGATIFSSKLIALCSGILGYHGKHQDKGNPYQLIAEALEYLFVSSPGYTSRGAIKGWPAFRWSTETSDGLCVPASYRGYYCNHIAPFAVIYMNSAGGNLADKYQILHGHFFHHIGIMTPDKHLPNYNSKSCWRNVWTDLVYGIPLYRGEQRKAMQWYANWLMKGRHKNYAAAGLLVYDRNEPAAAPAFDGDPTFFSPSGQMAVFRSDRSEQALYSFFKAMNEGNYNWSSNGGLSYDLWAKGAYLLVDSGECRWLIRGGAGKNDFSVDGLKSGVNRYHPPNPAHLENYFATSFLDYAEGKMKFAHKKITSPVNIRRCILFPHDEYFIVADSLESSGKHDYRMHLLCGGTEIPKNNIIPGVLKVEGKEVAWGKKFGVGEKEMPDFIEPVPRYKGMRRLKANNVEYTFDKVQNVTWTTLGRYPKGKDVEVKIFVVPGCFLETGCGVSHFGGYKRKADYYHPKLRFKQTGKKVKYLTVLYPRRPTEPEPKITQLKVKGVYAAKLVRGDIEDIVAFSDGKRITVEKITTDGKISYCRVGKGVLRTVMLTNGRSFSFGKEVIVSSGSELRNLALEFEGKKIIGHAEVEKPTKVDLYCSFKPSKVIWKRDRPVWVSPSTAPGIYEPVEIPFKYKANRISLELPQGKGRITVE